MVAKAINRYIDEETGRELVEYESGLVKDAATGHVVKPAPHTLITEENTSELYRRRVELKRATVRAVANANPHAAKYAADHGDMAYMAAITEQIMIKALRPGDPKQVEAAKFIQKESGDSEEEPAERTADDGLKDTIKNIADIARAYSTMRSGNQVDK